MFGHVSHSHNCCCWIKPCLAEKIYRRVINIDFRIFLRSCHPVHFLEYVQHPTSSILAINVNQLVSDNGRNSIAISTSVAKVTFSSSGSFRPAELHATPVASPPSRWR